MGSITLDHCRGLYLREFAYKTIPGVDISNKGGYLPELKRLRYHPVKCDEQLEILIHHYRNRAGEYVSVYSFEGKLIKDKFGKSVIDYSTAKINRIYLDFDNKDNPQKALDEALITVRSLTRHGIYPHCYFSGNKGIALYIEFITTDIKPENKKDVIALFFDMIKAAIFTEYENFFGLWIPTITQGFGAVHETLDHQVRGDIARVSRIPNTKHSSGYYCIPVTFGDMYKGIEHIKELAKAPREDLDLTEIIEYTMVRNETMPTIMRNLEKQVIANRESEQKKKQLEQRYYEGLRKRHPGRAGQIADADIEKAKSVSLSSIAGHEKKIICPFHADSEPSLSIDHDKNLWHCFGCGRGGSVIDWVMEKDGVGFKEAVRELLGATA